MVALIEIECYNTRIILFVETKERLIILKNFLKKNWRICFISYVAVYLPSFFYIEHIILPDSPGLHMIHCPLDDMIPFCEFFIIPYLLWFLYMAVVCVYVYFKGSDSEYLKLVLSLIIGMSLCLVFYVIYPNGLNLRPAEFSRDNIFTALVAFIYGTDSPANVFPSIHVYNSLLIHASVFKLKAFEHCRWIKNASLILCILICLSTVFLKQHSVYDVLSGAILSLVLYIAIYMVDYQKLFAKKKSKEEILE